MTRKYDVYRTIWDSDINIEDWADYRETLEEEGEVLTDYEFFDRVSELNDTYLDDERANLNKEVGTIICVGDIGLWYGRRTGFKIVGNNISDCLHSENPSNHWYVDTKGDLRCRSAHHDGVNWYTYRVIKDNLTERQVDFFLKKLEYGELTDNHISRYTRALGPDIAAVYGFNCPNQRKVS